MISGEDMVSKAREYLGTPFHYGGRLKGVGLDCGGLLIAAAAEFGVGVEIPSPPRGAALAVILKALAPCSLPVPLTDLRAGDVLVFASRLMPGHCGLLTGEGTVIHAYDSPSVRAVVETPLDARWRARLVGVFRIAPKPTGLDQ
jgi:cell wall-associated NlpC family hydrolase